MLGLGGFFEMLIGVWGVGVMSPGLEEDSGSTDLKSSCSDLYSEGATK